MNELKPNFVLLFWGGGVKTEEMLGGPNIRSNDCTIQNVFMFWFDLSLQVQAFRAAIKQGGVTLSEPRRKYIGT